VTARIARPATRQEASAATTGGPPCCIAAAPEHPIPSRVYMFPFVTVVDCPQDKMLSSMGQTLVCSRSRRIPNCPRPCWTPHSSIVSTSAGQNDCPELLQPHEGTLSTFCSGRAFQNSRRRPIERAHQPSRHHGRTSDVCSDHDPVCTSASFGNHWRGDGLMRSGPGGRPGRSAPRR